MLKVAVYPGSFDPIHLGHIDILETSAKLFDKVIWAIGSNVNKKCMFSLGDRVKMMNLVIPALNIKVAVFSGLLVDYAKRHNAVIIRGLRTPSDFEFEFQMTLINRKLAEDIMTIYLPARQKHIHLSSTAIRELITHSQSLNSFVPDQIAQYIQNLQIHNKTG